MLGHDWVQRVDDQLSAGPTALVSTEVPRLPLHGTTSIRCFQCIAPTAPAPADTLHSTPQTRTTFSISCKVNRAAPRRKIMLSAPDTE